MFNPLYYKKHREGVHRPGHDLSANGVVALVESVVESVVPEAKPVLAELNDALDGIVPSDKGASAREWSAALSKKALTEIAALRGLVVKESDNKASILALLDADHAAKA